MEKIGKIKVKSIFWDSKPREVEICKSEELGLIVSVKNEYFTWDYFFKVNEVVDYCGLKDLIFAAN